MFPIVAPTALSIPFELNERIGFNLKRLAIFFTFFEILPPFTTLSSVSRPRNTDVFFTASSTVENISSIFFSAFTASAALKAIKPRPIDALYESTTLIGNLLIALDAVSAD